MILLLCPLNAIESNAIKAHLKSGEYIHVADDWLHHGNDFKFILEADERERLILRNGSISCNDVHAIFYRPRLVRTDSNQLQLSLLQPHTSVEPTDRPFVTNELQSGLVGSLLATRPLWINNPFNERLAEQKIFQLSIARDVGFAVPETILSTDTEALEEFWHRHQGHVVTKCVSSESACLLPENALFVQQVSRNMLESLGTAAPSPVLFQELIPASLDLRVTVVGEEIFCSAIHSQQGAGYLDWRLDYTVPFTIYQLDDATHAAVNKLMRRLGLTFAAVDLRLTPRNGPVFLEINPRGAFLFVERLTGQQISRALAELLRHGEPHQSNAIRPE